MIRTLQTLAWLIALFPSILSAQAAFPPLVVNLPTYLTIHYDTYDRGPEILDAYHTSKYSLGWHQNQLARKLRIKTREVEHVYSDESKNDKTRDWSKALFSAEGRLINCILGYLIGQASEGYNLDFHENGAIRELTYVMISGGWGFRAGYDEEGRILSLEGKDYSEFYAYSNGQLSNIKVEEEGRYGRFSWNDAQVENLENQTIIKLKRGMFSEYLTSIISINDQGHLSNILYRLGKETLLKRKIRYDNRGRINKVSASIQSVDENETMGFNKLISSTGLENEKSIRWNEFGLIDGIDVKPSSALGISSSNATYDSSGKLLSYVYGNTGEQTYSYGNNELPYEIKVLESPFGTRYEEYIYDDNELLQEVILYKNKWENGIKRKTEYARIKYSYTYFD